MQRPVGLEVGSGDGVALALVADLVLIVIVAHHEAAGLDGRLPRQLES